MNYEIVAIAGPGVMFMHAIVTQAVMNQYTYHLPEGYTLTIAPTFQPCEVFHG